MSDELQRIRIACAEAMGEQTTIFRGCIVDKVTLCDTIPNYPSDPAAALTLVDALKSGGWTVEVRNGLDGTWECEFSRTPTPESHPDNVGFFRGEPRELHYMPAPTFAEAICRAFLKIKCPDFK